MDEGESDSQPPNMPEPHTVRFSPSVMLGLLAAGTDGGTRPKQNWSPPAPEEIQRALPQYEITGFIARGGMGAVYQGVQRALHRSVAIKILPPDIADDELDYAIRFQREAQAMASLSHPNIVTVYEAGETADGLLYFVMEHIDGTDVCRMIAKNGRQEPAEALRICIAVCAALECAHAHGIIHRDIKPSNVLINQAGVVKVADFGLAKLAGANDGFQTQSEVTVGTPIFLAPEAHLPGIALDARADLYAVGVMFYQMLTGVLPRGRFNSPSGTVPGLDPRLDAIIDRVMQADRDKRYPSAAALRAALEKVSPNFTPNRTDRKILTRKTLVATLALSAALVVGIIAYWQQIQAAAGAMQPTGPSWSQLPTAADKSLAFTNTLGMKFVPVPGTQVLFCIHETRKGDYAAYAAVNPELDKSWSNNQGYNAGGVSTADDHPVVKVNNADIEGFCAWLSKQEGRRYRLPTDHEWSCAVGIGEREDPKELPINKGLLLKDVFAWGLAWPPPPDALNMGDETLLRAGGMNPTLAGYKDGFVTTAPVMSCQPNLLGIYDLAGNVWERCSDGHNAQKTRQAGRGGSFDNGDRSYLHASARLSMPPETRSPTYGFRLVVER